MKKERPILARPELVRAYLEGRKTQTRRIMKPQPDCFWNDGKQPVNLPYDRSVNRVIRCPYGAPGDRLRVRERHAFMNPLDFPDETGAAVTCGVYRTMQVACVYATDAKLIGFDGKWRPSIHMPKWASRLTLDITDVRVERLQDISEQDVWAEGVVDEGEFEEGYSVVGFFREKWIEINGQQSWDDNPWVWVVETKSLVPGRLRGGRH